MSKTGISMELNGHLSLPSHFSPMRDPVSRNKVVDSCEALHSGPYMHEDIGTHTHTYIYTNVHTHINKYIFF